MKTSPIRRNKNIVPLSHDHHDGLLFCWKIRQGLKLHTDPGRITAYVRYFWQEHLLSHFREEEEFLFILPDDERIERAVKEHRRIAMLVDGILTSPAPESIRLLPILADTVDKHIRFEERDLFPHLEKVLPTSELEKIGLRLSKNPHMPDSWPDRYWTF